MVRHQNLIVDGTTNLVGEVTMSSVPAVVKEYCDNAGASDALKAEIETLKKGVAELSALVSNLAPKVAEVEKLAPRVAAVERIPARIDSLEKRCSIIESKAK